MTGKVIEAVSGVGKLLRVPVMEQASVASGRNQVGSRVNLANQVGSRVNLANGVTIRQGCGRCKRRRRIAHLVVSPKFIPQFPGKTPAMISPVRVDIADPFGRFARCSGTQVQCNLRLCLDEFAEAEELICAEGVVLRYAPGQVQFTNASIQRPHAIMPVIRGGEIAPEANHRGMEFPCQRQDFRIHAIDCIVRVQGDVVHQHTSIAFERDHQVYRFKRRDLAGIQLEVKGVLRPGTGWRLHDTRDQHFRRMCAAAQGELYAIVPIDMLQPQAAGVLQLPLDRKINLLQHAHLLAWKRHQEHGLC